MRNTRSGSEGLLTHKKHADDDKGDQPGIEPGIETLTFLSEFEINEFYETVAVHPLFAGGFLLAVLAQ
ncbi:MAG: hypothetical protein KKD56_08020, partial [Acidobacteria bacterium]|nr:hypothetical protein [Acidobacteriota bacterium]